MLSMRWFHWSYFCHSGPPSCRGVPLRSCTSTSTGMPGACRLALAFLCSRPLLPWVISYHHVAPWLLSGEESVFVSPQLPFYFDATLRKGSYDLRAAQKFRAPAGKTAKVERKVIAVMMQKDAIDCLLKQIASHPITKSHQSLVQLVLPLLGLLLLVLCHQPGGGGGGSSTVLINKLLCLLIRYWHIPFLFHVELGHTRW